MKTLVLAAIFCLPFFVSAQTKIKPPIDLVKFLNEKPANLSVSQYDINGDKTPEYFVTVKSDCGAGRCATTLYQKKGRKFVVLFESEIDLRVDYGKTEGMQNLYELDWSADKNLYSHYRWNGQKYIEFSCTESIRFGKYKGLAKQVPCDKEETSF